MLSLDLLPMSEKPRKPYHATASHACGVAHANTLWLRVTAHRDFHLVDRLPRPHCFTVKLPVENSIPRLTLRNAAETLVSAHLSGQCLLSGAYVRVMMQYIKTSVVSCLLMSHSCAKKMQESRSRDRPR